MATFCFMRHGQMDVSMAGKQFYKGFAYNMMTLSEKGVGTLMQYVLGVVHPENGKIEEVCYGQKKISAGLKIQDERKWVLCYTGCNIGKEGFWME